MNQTIRTMTKENLTLTHESAGIRGRISLTQFIVGFHIDVRAFLQVTKVIVRALVETKDVMPGSPGRWTSCQSDASVRQSQFLGRVLDVLPSGLGGGGG
jgi:hypothetical protein